MKGYEQAFRTVLPGRVPVIIRVDGKAFHTYTRGCKRPWDDRLTEVMDLTAIELCKTIQGAQVAYTQSDEISILVHSYKKLNSSAWFDNQVQKMVSVASGVASATFTANSYKIWEEPRPKFAKDIPASGYNIKPAYFDARVFILPEQEVNNYFVWRQQDATRNSVQMLARSLYSHKELDKKNNSELQELTFLKGRNWNDEPTKYKRGRCVLKETVLVDLIDDNYGYVSKEPSPVYRSKWAVDNEIPVFSEKKDYINGFLISSPEEKD